MAPVILEMSRRQNILAQTLVTAQHREMLDQTLSVFGITPDFDLNIMRENQTLYDITSRALIGVGDVIRRQKPDIVLVHGDTTTTFAAALAAFYEKTPIGHVEAGLRTFNIYEPFPEELNRRLTSCVAALNFAPTSQARENLLHEGVRPESIFVTGNTAIDAVLSTTRDNYIFENPELNKLDFANCRVIAMTAHRRENIGQPLVNICRGVKQIVGDFEDVVVVYAVHPNRAVKDNVERELSNVGRVLLTPPLNMTDMHNLIARSYLVLTDSGGLQEEAPALDKPVIVLRNVTERPEGLISGTLELAGTEKDAIYRSIAGLLTDSKKYEAMASARNPFGDGFAAKRIVDALEFSLGLRDNPPEDFV